MSALKSLYRNVKKHTGRIVTGLATAGIIALGPILYVKSQDCLRGGEIERDISRLEQTLSDRYGIDVSVWKKPIEEDRPIHPLKSSLRSHSPYMSLKALRGLEVAMSYYPAELIQKHAPRIQIIRAFLESTEEIEKQGATPFANINFFGNMTISAGRNDWLRYHKTVLGRIFESESFHHELAHEITNRLPREDWKAIHPDAVYNSSTWKSLPSTPKGFFNRYCTHSIGEDITGTVQLLYSRDYEKRVARDPILRKKAECLKSWYFKISNGAIDGQYWTAVQSGKIPVMKTIDAGRGK